jgi:spermidine synthase
MKPRVLLASAVTPDGSPITLTREADALVVRVDNAPLMSSRVHGSEELLAAHGCAHLRDRPRARVLVGGLGMGFTLRATLDALARAADVVVSELLACNVEWNRGPLADLAAAPLDDPRVSLRVGDLAALLREAPGASFDAILLDVDNGPDAFTVRDNAWLYRRDGLRAMRAALRPGGRLVVWSAYASPRFGRALRDAAFSVEIVPVRARGAVR